MKFWRRKARLENAIVPSSDNSVVAPERERLREFVYLDEVSVQSLLVSLVGTLPAEVTNLSAKSNEAETSGALSANAPLIAKAELAARFKGATSSSSQVLSRAVAESLFKTLYDLIEHRLVRAEKDGLSGPTRGELIELEVELSADPIYGFNATMGVFSDLADDYPPLLDNSETAMILKESGPLNKVLERMLVGLIPIKATSLDLRAGVVDGNKQIGPPAYFEKEGVTSDPLFVVGVTEQSKYWRDVRRVLFSKSRFTILGRIARDGIQDSWTPVKLTEVMRAIAPQFPDAITRVGQVGFTATVNVREESNRAALETALQHYAATIGGQGAKEKSEQIAQLAKELRHEASSLSAQTNAFARVGDWLIENGVLQELPPDARLARNSARAAAGLVAGAATPRLTDYVPAAQTVPVTESMIDVEVVAIYW